ncbi:MAG: RNA methyltransferase [Planctomycetota bacterium]
MTPDASTTGPAWTPVDDLDDPRLVPYRNQKDAWLRVQRNGGTGLGGRFLAEGEIVAGELLASAYPVESVLITPTRLETLRPELERLPGGTPVFIAERPLAERIVGFDMHRGVLALGRRTPGPSVAELAESCNALLVLEGLSNHDNIGSLYRSFSALGPPRRGVVLAPGCADPLYRKALRVSMGHALRVPTATADEWPGDLEVLDGAGFETLALTPEADAIPIADLQLRSPPARVALMVGAEGPGLSEAAMSACRHRARIPMAPGVDSLNVAVAAAIALAAVCEPAPNEGTSAAGSRL